MLGSQGFGTTMLAGLWHSHPHHSVAVQMAYWPLAILGLGPLLPVIGFMYVARLMEFARHSPSIAADCPGPGHCPYFHCCREPGIPGASSPAASCPASPK